MLGGTEGIHLSPNSGPSILKMNSIISGGLDEGEGGIGGGITGAPAPPGHGLGPKSADPLSPLNHPVREVVSAVLRGTQRLSAFPAGDLLVDLSGSQRFFGNHGITWP
jgi:hypothetical protein